MMIVNIKRNNKIIRSLIIDEWYKQFAKIDKPEQAVNR